MNRITKLTLSGFKSIVDPITVEFKGLTILAGANSSGKSSVMQPLLLMKQTLDAPYQPLDFKLDGPNVWFENYADFIPKSSQADSELNVKISIRSKFERDLLLNSIVEKATVINLLYSTENQKITAKNQGYSFEVTGMSRETANSSIEVDFQNSRITVNNTDSLSYNRCTVDRIFVSEVVDINNFVHKLRLYDFNSAIMSLIHIPGLRGQYERGYSKNSYGKDVDSGYYMFAGTFDRNFATVLREYQAGVTFIDPMNTNQLLPKPEIEMIAEQLQEMSLTGGVLVEQMGSRINIKVSRYPTKPAESDADRVDISDVGYGVSQVLPVLVGLLVAQPGQMVYIEQPELHLHPNAQYLLAKPIVDAVNRGVNVVFETHSSILLLGIQTAVAKFSKDTPDKKGTLSPEKVSLNWFQRDAETGLTEHTSATLDENGAFLAFDKEGNEKPWPIDFDSVQMRADNEFLDSIEVDFPEQ